MMASSQQSAAGSQPPCDAAAAAFAVVGVGPVGAVLAAYLARAGHRVAVADVDAPHIEAIRRDGIEVTGVREARGKPGRCVTTIAELAGDDYDYVVVATKASVLSRVMPDVARIAGMRSWVVSFQNGLDTEAEIARHVGADRTLRCVVNYAGGKIADGRIKMTFFTGRNVAGAATPAGEAVARRFAETLDAAGVETDYSPEIRRFEWEKTILNAAMSPLCALTGLTMRECVEWPAAMGIVERLIDEGIAAARADGFEWPAGFREHCLGYLGKGGYHRPSLWVDIASRRPTEIGVLSGRIADIADARGVPAPTHRLLAVLVEGIERSWASPHAPGGG
ncbi:MAG: ketopantoate reductase family protein [Myxococcota bacterium]|nr:ketopantoate reductase family protein [Myxococcota bacterium]